jgi:hypothetical protein
MKITFHKIITESAEYEDLFMQLWKIGDDAGEGYNPEGLTWYQPNYFVASHGNLDIYVYKNEVFGIGYAYGTWAVSIGFID